MKFHCESCGKEIRVPRAYAGKKGRCPACKVVLTAPIAPTRADPSKAIGEDPLGDLTLLDVPEERKAESEPTPEPDHTGEAYEQFRKLHGGLAGYEGTEVQERRLPWIIDIFLYPFNTKGMGIIFLCIGIPLTLRVVTKTLSILTLYFPPLLVFLVLFIIIHWGSSPLLCSIPFSSRIPSSFWDQCSVRSSNIPGWSYSAPDLF